MSAPVPDPVRRARAYLLRVAEPPAPALAAFVAAHGPIEAARLVRAGQTPPGVRDETAARRLHDRVDEDLAAAERVGARLVIPEDDEWPTSRLQALDPAGTGWRWAVAPLGLWLRGSARLVDVVARARKCRCPRGHRVRRARRRRVRLRPGRCGRHGHLRRHLRH